MSFKIKSVDNVSFVVDVESYHRLLNDMEVHIEPIIAQSVQQFITTAMQEKMVNKIINGLDADFYYNLYERIAQTINYGSIVEAIKGEVVNILLANDRFNTLLSRGINNATVGVVDETVERVAARLEIHINGEGDV